YLPLVPGWPTKVGLGLWRHAVLGYALEVGSLLIAFVMLRRTLASSRARAVLDLTVVGLVILQTLQTFAVLPPASMTTFALSAQAVYLTVIVLAAIVDRIMRTRRGGALRRSPGTRRGPRAGR